MSPFNNAGIFLIQLSFNLYILIVMLRILMQWVGVHFYNPIAQFILKFTNPVVIPIRRMIPSFKGFDLASLILLVILEMLKLMCVIGFQFGVFPAVLGLMIWAFADLLGLLLSIFFYTLLIRVIISWLNPHLHSPITEVLYLLTEPLLRPARRIIPLIAGFDLSPILVMIVIQVINILFVAPLIAIGEQLALASLIIT